MGNRFRRNTGGPMPIPIPRFAFPCDHEQLFKGTFSAETNGMSLPQAAPTFLGLLCDKTCFGTGTTSGGRTIGKLWGIERGKRH